MAIPTGTPVLAPPDNRALGEGIAAQLRDAILKGYFDPGARLPEEALALQMGVSRGPIRDALVQLEREGLIVHRRNRGAFVARLSREDLQEVYTLRLAIERLAVERACTSASVEQIAELQSIVDEIAAQSENGITEQAAAELDLKFHDLIYQSANHRRLLETWMTLRPQIHILLLNRNVAHQDFREYVVVTHQQILDAIREHAVAEALMHTEDHLQGSYDRVLRSIDGSAITIPTESEAPA